MCFDVWVLFSGAESPSPRAGVEGETTVTSGGLDHVVLVEVTGLLELFVVFLQNMTKTVSKPIKSRRV